MELDDLLDNPKSLTRYRIIRAGRTALAERGLTTSMEEIAEAAGLSRRSLFRHFESRAQLVAAALASMIDVLDTELAEALDLDAPLEPWLTEVVRRWLSVQVAAGLASWQLAAAEEDELPPELVQLNRRRKATRHRLTNIIADNAWRRAGGQGACPSKVVDTVALGMSAFTARSLLTDYEIGFDRTVELTATVILAVIDGEIDRARPRRPRAARSKTG